MKKIILLIFLLLIPSVSLAVTAVDRYVDTDCTNNGDGTSSSCAASSGAAGAYTTLNNAVTDVISDYPNFVSSDVQVTIHCEGTAVDTSEPNITGITDDSTRYLHITVDEGNRHDGKWNTSKYRLANSGYFAALRIQEPFTRISWLQIENNKTSAGAGTEANGIKLTLGSPSSAFIVIENVIARYTGDYTNQEAFFLEDTYTDSNGTKIYRNNIFYDWKKGIKARTGNDGTLYLYNNTCYSNAASSTCYTIRDYGTGTITYAAKNNLANGSATGYDIDGNFVYTHSNNLSEDTTSPDNTYDSKAVTFENEGSDDFHLASGDTNAKDSGTDLSGASQGFTIDIDNQTRSGTWDIGADEYQSGATAAPFTTLKQMGIL